MWYWGAGSFVTGIIKNKRKFSSFLSLGTWEGYKPDMREMEGKQEEIELSPFGLGRGSIYPFKKLLKFLENLG